MKQILVATDLSPRSDRALDRAVLLAKLHGARLVVLHVVDEDLPPSIADRRRDEALGAIQSYLSSVAADRRPDADARVVLGTDFADIIREAEAADAELVVLGIHRVDVLRDLFRGTTVERVVRHGSRPVLVVKSRASDPYGRVMVGVDFSVYSRRAIEFAVQLVQDGEFHLVHAFDIPFAGFLRATELRTEIRESHERQIEAMVAEEMQSFIANFGEAGKSQLKRVMRQGAAFDVLSAEVERLRPDLLVVGTHGRTGVAHALLGSIAEALLKNPPCDVLAVRAW